MLCLHFLSSCKILKCVKHHKKYYCKVINSIIIRQATSGIILKQKQRPTARLYEERVFKLQVKYLPSLSSESQGRRDLKIIKSQREWEHHQNKTLSFKQARQMSSQSLKQQAQGLHGLISGPLSIYYSY